MKLKGSRRKKNDHNGMERRKEEGLLGIERERGKHTVINQRK